MPYLLLSCLSLFWFSCSVVPDLSAPAVFTDANQSAVDLSTLERKFMYGMFHLWVDEGGEPFRAGPNPLIPQKSSGIRILKEGRKEGLWISWDKNKTKVSNLLD